FIESNSLSQCSNDFEVHISQITRYFKQIEKHIACPILVKKGLLSVASEEIKQHLPALEEFIAILEPLLMENEKLKLYFPIFIAHIFVEQVLNSLQVDALQISSYSHALIRNYGLLAKHELNTYDLIYINHEHEHLINSNLWIQKYKYSCRVKLYATQKYLDLSPPLDSPSDLSQHHCLCFSNQDQNEWTFEDKLGSKQKIIINSDLLIDTTFMQSLAAGESMGIAKLEPSIAGYFKPNNLIPVLTDYLLEKSEWVVYVKKDCHHPQLSKCLDKIIALLKVVSE
ncbi:MAG: hypothetical protein ACJA0H_001010, partial [Francisellaceae bacterium]